MESSCWSKSVFNAKSWSACPMASKDTSWGVLPLHLLADQFSDLQFPLRLLGLCHHWPYFTLPLSLLWLHCKGGPEDPHVNSSVLQKCPCLSSDSSKWEVWMWVGDDWMKIKIIATAVRYKILWMWRKSNNSGNKQNTTASASCTKYKTKQIMVRTAASQTQGLMHIPELFYKYYNCPQRDKTKYLMSKLQPWYKLL